LEISELCDEVENGLQELKNTKVFKGQKRDDKVALLKTRLNRARVALRSLKVEFRELSKIDQKPHADRAALLEERINKLSTDLEFAERNDPEQQKQDAAMVVDYNAVLNKGKAIQDEDLKILSGLNRQLEDTEQIGASTLVKMQEQSEQMRSIDKQVDEVASNVKLASRQVRVMVRRWGTDRLIQCLMFCIVAGVIVIIVYSVVTKKGNTNLPQT